MNHRSCQSEFRATSRASGRRSSPVSSPRGATRGIWNRKIEPCAAAARLGTIASARRGASSSLRTWRPSQSRDCVDLVEISGRDRVSETARRLQRAESNVTVARGRRRRAEGLVGRRDRGDLRTRLACARPVRRGGARPHGPRARAVRGARTSRRDRRVECAPPRRLPR